MSGFRARRAVGAVFVAKGVRTFCYGYLGIVLPLYLGELGLSAAGIGAFVTLTLVGSAVLTWAIRFPAERLGTRAALVALAALAVVSAALMVFVQQPWVVVLAAMLGNVAVGAGETGPFLSIEQVVLARAVAVERRTSILSLYNLLGYGAAALGAAAVAAGPPRALFAGFLAAALVQAVAYAGLEAAAPAARTAAPVSVATPLI